MEVSDRSVSTHDADAIQRVVPRRVSEGHPVKSRRSIWQRQFFTNGTKLESSATILINFESNSRPAQLALAPFSAKHVFGSISLWPKGPSAKYPDGVYLTREVHQQQAE